MHKRRKTKASNPLTHNRFMNNDLNHNLVCRNGNTIKTTFHGARQREAVQQLTYEHAYKVARVYEGQGGGGWGSGGGGGQREDLNGMHSALCVTSEFHEYVYGKRGKRRTSGLSRFVFERFAMRERERVAPTFVPKSASLLPRIKIN